MLFSSNMIFMFCRWMYQYQIIWTSLLIRILCCKKQDGKKFSQRQDRFRGEIFDINKPKICIHRCKVWNSFIYLILLKCWFHSRVQNRECSYHVNLILGFYYALHVLSSTKWQGVISLIFSCCDLYELCEFQKKTKK